MSEHEPRSLHSHLQQPTNVSTVAAPTRPVGTSKQQPSSSALSEANSDYVGLLLAKADPLLVQKLVVIAETSERFKESNPVRLHQPLSKTDYLSVVNSLTNGRAISEIHSLSALLAVEPALSVSPRLLPLLTGPDSAGGSASDRVQNQLFPSLAHLQSMPPSCVRQMLSLLADRERADPGVRDSVAALLKDNGLKFSLATSTQYLLQSTDPAVSALADLKRTLTQTPSAALTHAIANTIPNAFKSGQPDQIALLTAAASFLHDSSNSTASRTGAQLESAIAIVGAVNTSLALIKDKQQNLGEIGLKLAMATFFQAATLWRHLVPYPAGLVDPILPSCKELKKSRAVLMTSRGKCWRASIA